MGYLNSIQPGWATPRCAEILLRFLMMFLPLKNPVRYLKSLSRENLLGLLSRFLDSSEHYILDEAMAGSEQAFHKAITMCIHNMGGYCDGTTYRSGRHQ